MTADVNLVVTSEDVYETIRGHYSSRDVSLSAGERALTIDGLSITFRASPTGSAVRPDQGAKMAYMDQDYARLRDWSQYGWRTVWLNLRGELAPDTLPVQDVDIHALDALYRVSSHFNKPSLRQCLAWLDQWDVPENIRQHVTAVAWCAYVLAVLMRNQGVILDPVLAHRGGLLHDIDKIQTLRQTQAHGEAGAEFLEEQGYPETAAIVRGHIMHKILEPHSNDRPWETKLVYFADKLIEGERIVPFDVRMKALTQRYPRYRESMRRAESFVWALSEKICSILSISSHEILISTLVELQNY